MIILEGANGTGKTTLANKLARDLDFTIHKFTKIPETQEEFDEQVGTSNYLARQRVIQDRCPVISEFIYGPETRKYKRFSSLYDIRNFFHCFPVRIRPILLVAGVMQPKPKIEISRDKTNRIKLRYSRMKLDLLSEFRIDCWAINPFTFDYSEFLTKLKTEIEKRS